MRILLYELRYDFTVYVRVYVTWSPESSVQSPASSVQSPEVLVEQTKFTAGIESALLGGMKAKKLEDLLGL